MDRLSVGALLFLCAMPLSVSSAQEPAVQTTTQEIVTLSFDEAVVHTKEGKKVIADLQVKFAPRQAQLQALDAEVQALRKQVEGAKGKLSDAEQANLVQSLDKKQKQLQRQAEDFKSDSQTESQEAFQQIGQKVFLLLQSYAAQHRYSAVIERGSDGSPVVWFATRIDITDELTKAYDAQGEPAVPQPAKKPLRPPGSKP